MRNVGVGPLTLEFQYDAEALATAIQNETDIPAGSCHMNQEILWSDSAITNSATFRDAGPCVFHVPHLHFHYQNMGRYKMFALQADGNPHAVAWPDPGQVSADPVATSNKIGFCTIDVEDYSFDAPASEQRPRTYSFPTCNVPNGYASPGSAAAPGSQFSAGAPEYMGISPGWGDIYTWDLPTQYIDISNVPDGIYEVTSTSNPDGGIQTPDHLPPAPAAAGAARAAAVADPNGTSLASSVETGVSCIQVKTNASGTTTVKSLQEFPSMPNNAPLPTCDTSGATTGPDIVPPGLGPGTLPNTSSAQAPPPLARPLAARLAPSIALLGGAALAGGLVLAVVERRRRPRLR